MDFNDFSIFLHFDEKAFYLLKNQFIFVKNAYGFIYESHHASNESDHLGFHGG